MKYKVYLAKLKREDAYPKCVYKIGITSSTDAMKRLTYAEADEPHPISHYFPDIKVMKTVWCKDRTEAETLEKYIMDSVKGSDRYFHDWYEKYHISGITEMRKWNYEEVQKVFGILEEYEKGLLLS